MDLVPDLSFGGPYSRILLTSKFPQTLRGAEQLRELLDKMEESMEATGVPVGLPMRQRRIDCK